MAEIGRFDSDMQMFVEPVHEVNLDVANFHKWRVENGKVNDDLAADVINLVDHQKKIDDQKIADVRAELTNLGKPKLTREEHIAENGAE